MKRIITLATALFFFINVQGQDLKKILGTWEIKNFQYSNNANNNEKNTPFRKYKTYTPTNFIVTEIDNQTNITTTSIFGTYDIKDGIYTEKILSVNRESAGMIGRTFSFTLTFEDNDKMYSTGSFNGMKTSELWVRIKNGNETEQLLQGKGDGPLLQTAFKEVKIPLCVIKNGDKYLTLKSENEKDMAIKLIDQNDIGTIEVIKNETAVRLFGEAGKNGVVIIGLKEGKLESVLETLKSKGVTTTE
jgi:hypothetical protein